MRWESAFVSSGIPIPAVRVPGGEEGALGAEGGREDVGLTPRRRCWPGNNGRGRCRKRQPCAAHNNRWTTGTRAGRNMEIGREKRDEEKAANFLRPAVSALMEWEASWRRNFKPKSKQLGLKTPDALSQQIRLQFNPEDQPWQTKAYLPAKGRQEGRTRKFVNLLPFMRFVCAAFLHGSLWVGVLCGPFLTER